MHQPIPFLPSLRTLSWRMGADVGLRTPEALFQCGDSVIDARLGGGLERAALHEILVGVAEDASSAAGFALMLASRASQKPILWVREERAERVCGRIYAPGLTELGFDPDAVLLVSAPDTLSLLRAGADIVKCAGVGAVLIEPWGKAAVVDLTATRRLALAAALSGVTALLIRSGADPMPSAAQTRWQVRSAASNLLEGDAPGHPAFDISLLRHRSGIAGFDARMEWDRDTRSFRTPLSGGVPAIAAIGTGDPSERHAA